MIKPVMFIESDIPTFPIFCTEFTRIYKEIQNKLRVDCPGSGPTDGDSILAIMFLQIILECLITYYIRYAIGYFKNISLHKVWKRIEDGTFLVKLNFIIDISNSSDKNLKTFCEFAKKSNTYRNKILHGHKLSYIFGSDHYCKPSPAMKMVEEFDIDDYVLDFNSCVNAFFKLMRKTTLTMARENNNFDFWANTIENQFKDAFLMVEGSK